VRYVSTEPRVGERFHDGATAALALAPMPVQERSKLRDVSRGSRPEEEVLGTMSGHFAVFDKWTLIDSRLEGKFMERIAPGAFQRTFALHHKALDAGLPSQSIRCFFQHGRDPTCGLKILGPVLELEEDAEGARYEVQLYDVGYTRDLAPGLRNGSYGASFRFRCEREEVNTRPLRSEHNPEGVEERTIFEASVSEFGPCPFGAYPDASAQLRELVAPASDRKPRPREHAEPPVRRHRLARDCGAWLLSSPDAQCVYSNLDTPVRVRLSADVQRAMRTEAWWRPGVEAGGLLFGRERDGFLDVTRFRYDGPNAVRLPNMHRIDPAHAVREVRAMAAWDYELLGHVHSHTDASAPLPSDADLRAWSNWRRSNELDAFIGVIVSPKHRRAQIGAWVVRTHGRRDICEMLPL
jgi:HK97 family phage prohead protease